jgi:hypothetical protein
MPKEEQPVVGNLPGEIDVDALVATLNLFASIRSDSQQSAEEATAPPEEAKARPGVLAGMISPLGWHAL